MISGCVMGIMLAILGLFALAYFKFKSLDKAVKTAWLRLDGRLKDRAEFISPVALHAASMPNIERPFVYHLQALKDECLHTTAIPRRALCETEVTQKLKTVFSTARQYPHIQQDINFIKLQTAVSRAQVRLKRAQTRYNNAVQDYNTLTNTIPLNLLAQALEFPKHEYFSVSK